MDTTYVKLLNASFRFVSYRPRSEKEIRDFLQKKLTQWKVAAAQTVEKVLERLREYGYIDDKKFAQWWIEQRQQFRPKGMRLVLRELQLKGVSREILSELQEKKSRFYTHDREANDNSFSEIETAKRAIEKKRLIWQKLPSLDQKKKIYGFLGRRGFSSDTIMRIIDEIM